MNSLRFDAHFGMLTALKHACMMVGIVAFLVGCEGGSGGGSKSEQINGIAVPLVPDSTANQATVSGVDSNSNGIRDDVDRALATEFGQGAATYQEAATFARTLQVRDVGKKNGQRDAQVGARRSQLSFLRSFQ